jgi:hypothetical protein
MGHGAWDMGHGAWGMGHGAWGMGHGTWGKGIGLGKKADAVERGMGQAGGGAPVRRLCPMPLTFATE